MPANNPIALRNEEVQEILTKVPHWMIRWGNVVILVILLLLFLASYMIKYPETIPAQVVITTSTPPEKLVAPTSGRITAILVSDQSSVVEGTPLAIIENSADYKDVFLLQELVEQISIGQQSFPFERFVNTQLGEVESAFALFQKEYSAEVLNKKLQPYAVEGRAQGYESARLQERLGILQTQKDISQGELELQKKDLDRYENLYKKGIVSTQEIDKQRLQYLQAQKNFQGMQGNISQLKSSLNALNRESQTTQINQRKETVGLERNVVQAYYQLKKALRDWELHYVLRASLTGKVTFLQVWTVNQTVSAGDQVFAVIPESGLGYVGKAKAALANSGKLRTGQQVVIRLANYPDHEFGVIRGKVQAISLTPDKEGYLRIAVSLPHGLQTSYHKKIRFQQEMSGTAEIITQDKRLIERLLYQFREIFTR